MRPLGIRQTYLRRWKSGNQRHEKSEKLSERYEKNVIGKQEHCWLDLSCLQDVNSNIHRARTARGMYKAGFYKHVAGRDGGSGEMQRGCSLLCLSKSLSEGHDDLVVSDLGFSIPVVCLQTKGSHGQGSGASTVYKSGFQLEQNLRMIYIYE